jgi:hypothetical protein
MKMIKIDLLVTAAYFGMTWGYFTMLPEPNLWLFGFIMLMAFAIDVRSYKTGIEKGAELTQAIMKETLDSKNWEIVRKAK